MLHIRNSIVSCLCYTFVDIVEDIHKMSVIRIKKGYDLPLKGSIQEYAMKSVNSTLCAIVPDDFVGLVPRLDVREGDIICQGGKLYHDRDHEEIAVTSSISGVIKEIRRGERRKIEAIVIEKCDTAQLPLKFDISRESKDVLLESGLWAFMSQRPYDVVPSPDVRPRDIFVTAFDSAPLAPDFSAVLERKKQYIAKGIEILAGLTDGNVYVGVRDDSWDCLGKAVVNKFIGPHPAGNVGVQIANVKPVNKGEVVWTLDLVTVARIGELFTTGYVPYDTVVAVTGSRVDTPYYISSIIGSPVVDLLGDSISGNVSEANIISGNVLTGKPVSIKDFLRFPYRHISVIERNSNPGEFMGWASLSPDKFSVYRSFFSWLCPKKKVALDSKLNGGERAIVMAGEYDKVFPMDIYAEFLIKSIIAFDIDKMEQLGIYEVAPEDFALCEFVDTSKLELQRIVRDGLTRLRKEME